LLLSSDTTTPWRAKGFAHAFQQGRFTMSLPMIARRHAKMRVCAVAAMLLSGLPAQVQTAQAQTAQVQATTVDADQESASFSVTISGFPVGEFSFAANRKGVAYAVKARAASSGLAGILRPFTLVSTTRGVERNGRYSPQSYVSQSDGARGGRGGELAFNDGVPIVIRADEEREPGAPLVDPATQKGAVDPVTALYAVLRDVPREGACKLDLRLFDGHRGSRMTLSNPKASGDGIVCAGFYRRIDGYPAKELAERPTFSFLVTYQPIASGQLRAVELSLDSSYGPAKLSRN
jgi:hypothetical protein